MKKRILSTAAILLALLMLMSGFTVLAEAQSEAEACNVTVYTTKEKAHEAGMYLSIRLDENAEARMRKRLGQIAAANQDRFDKEETAANVINGWFDSTHFNIATCFVVTLGTEGDIQIPADYVDMYDMVALQDDSGRALMYTIRQYDVDLYDQICQEAISLVEEQFLPLIPTCFSAIMETLEDDDMRTKLEVAFDELGSGFTIGIGDIQSILPLDLALTDDLTLAQALDTTSYVMTDNMGVFECVTVSSKGDAQAWYKLSMEDGKLSGVKLSSAVTLSEMKSTTTADATLWLDENKQVVYITSPQEGYSADAKTLNAMIAKHGGAYNETADDKAEEGGSSAAVWVIVIILVVAAVAAFLWYIMKGNKKSKRPRSTSGAAPMKKEAAPAEEEAVSESEDK